MARAEREAFEAELAAAIAATKANIQAAVAEAMAVPPGPGTDECPAFIRESIARTMRRIRPPLGQRHQRKLEDLA